MFLFLHLYFCGVWPAVCVAGVQCSDGAPGCHSRARSREFGLCPAVQSGGHTGFWKSVFRPLTFTSFILSGRPKVCHLHPSLFAHVCSYCALAAQDHQWDETETFWQAGQKGLREHKCIQNLLVTVKCFYALIFQLFSKDSLLCLIFTVIYQDWIICFKAVKQN